MASTASKTSGRRIGSDSSSTRQQLLAAAGQLMREEGYAEVTSRKLAQKAGLKPQLVHYYFRTMDDLFEELFRQACVHQLALLDRVAKSEDPLAALFDLACDPASAGMQLEFLALSNHRKGLRAQIAEFGGELNRREAEILRSEFERRGIALSGFTIEELATLFQTSARGLAFAGQYNNERYQAARDAVLNWLTGLGSGPTA